MLRVLATPALVLLFATTATGLQPEMMPAEADFAQRVQAAPACLAGSYTMVEQKLKVENAAVPAGAIDSWVREWTGRFAIRGGVLFLSKTAVADGLIDQMEARNPGGEFFDGVGEPESLIWIDPASTANPIGVFQVSPESGPWIMFQDRESLFSTRFGVRPLFFAALGLSTHDRAGMVAPWTAGGSAPTLPWEPGTATTQALVKPDGDRFAWTFSEPSVLADVLSVRQEDARGFGGVGSIVRLIECRDFQGVKGSRLRVPREIVNTTTLVGATRTDTNTIFTLRLSDLTTAPAVAAGLLDRSLPAGTKVLVSGRPAPPTWLDAPRRVDALWPGDG